MVLRVLGLIELGRRDGDVLVESEAGEVMAVAIDVRKNRDKERWLVFLCRQVPSRRLAELQKEYT